MKLYRGTQREKVKGHQKVTSWTPSLPVAVIYSAVPGDVWRSSRPYFPPTATIHSAHMDDDVKVLDLCGDYSHCSFERVMKLLKYGSPDGLTYEEGIKLAEYMHNRIVGRVAGGEFSYVVFDEDGEPLGEEEIPFSLQEPESIISWHFIPDFSDDPEEVAPLLWADAFVFADSATFRNVARRLGYKAIIYEDVFQGGEFAAPPLLGCDVYELEGVAEGVEITENEEVPIHKTVRPLEAGVLSDFESVPTAEVLPEVTCEAPAASPSKLKAKLLR